MSKSKPLRVMWLLNHSSARKFEIPMLHSIGIKEIFLPKSYPDDPSFRSASVDYSEDENLSIPEEDLTLLNAADWYRGASRAAWEVASRYFDVCFFIVQFPDVLINAAKHFNGALLWRAYGLDRTLTYSKVIDYLSPSQGLRSIRNTGNRFFFAKAYDHIDDVESDLVKNKAVYLPLGLHNTVMDNQWEGKDKRIFFVCPDIAFNSYYQEIYNKFISDFSSFSYVIGGAQPINVDDPAVLGYTPLAVHEQNMQQLRLMFYHSTEPNHIHYHPFEAIRAGMPLVFMAGGLLDRMGGIGLPGRCESIQEARSKIRRILNDDWALINSIRQSQSILLEPMKPENCVQAWRDGFRHILAELEVSRAEQSKRRTKPKRIAIILPVEYRGGTLRGAKLLAQAIYQGSRQVNEAVEVVLLHLADAETYPDEEFADLFPGIKRREFHWKALPCGEARRAMRYAGNEGWEPRADSYLVVDDGIQQLHDCDLWLIVSDRLSKPLLPLRPCVHMVYDYLQRYESILRHGADQPFLNAARCAERVLVTTRFTQQDAMQYAGVHPSKVVKLPMLGPDFSAPATACSPSEYCYFVWTTNPASHKNHVNAAKALKYYYEELEGQLDCVVTGVDTAGMLKSTLPHLLDLASLVKGSKALRIRLRWRGELPDKDYQLTLAGAAFLWHAGHIDNGTFSVIEAASLGVPALSSDYPAMHEIDEQFSLNLAWMNANDPKAMAEQLKQMELTHQARRGLLPTRAKLAEQHVDKLAGEYWEVIRECL